MKNIVMTKDILKEVDGVEILKNININVKKGEIYGLLGPNGAGKTTLLKALCNLVSINSGSINIFEEEISSNSYEYLRRIGALIEEPFFEEELSGIENLKIHCEYLGYYNKTAVAEILELVSMAKYKNKLVKSYSTGMRQRLGIGRAIISKPELLILDEPINGLDPAGIKEMRDLFKTLSRDFGTTIIISSHILSELELLCDTIGILKEGELHSEEPIEVIKNKNINFFLLEVENVKRTAAILKSKLEIDNFKIDGEGFIRIYDESVIQSELIGKLVSEDINIKSFQVKTSSLEDYYLSETEEGTDE